MLLQPASDTTQRSEYAMPNPKLTTRLSIHRCGIRFEAVYGILHELCAAGAWMVLAAWVLGRVVGDAWRWSQFLFWIPTLFVLAALSISLAAFWVVLPASRPNVRRVRTLGLPAAAIGVLGYFVFVECRVLWALASSSESARPELRVMFWNPSNWIREGLAEGVAEHRPDVLIVANAPWRTPWGALDALDGRSREVVRQGRFHVVSTLPVVRSGGLTLGLPGRVPHPHRDRPDSPSWAEDPGYAAFVEVETAHGSLVIWAIDLPSDPTLSRRDLARDARAAIDAWTPDPDDDSGFPTPEVIVGDFNMTRDSRALRHLVGDLPDAYTQAGWGYAATWPRVLPVIHIDQAFVGGAWRAMTYRIVDPGLGTHRAVIVGLGRR